MREGVGEESRRAASYIDHHPCKACFALMGLGQASDSWQWGFCKLLEEVRLDHNPVCRGNELCTTRGSQRNCDCVCLVHTGLSDLLVIRLPKGHASQTRLQLGVAWTGVQLSLLPGLKSSFLCPETKWP